MTGIYLSSLPQGTALSTMEFYGEHSGIAYRYSMDFIENNLSITESQISDLGNYQPLDPILTNTTASFTVALNNKLSGIENNATADQTGAEIVSLIDSELGNSSWQSQANVSWGLISGTLSNQTDLQNALNAKADASAIFSGDYNDLTNTPIIPTNNNQLINGAGYITDYTVTELDVTQHQTALSITESQISDLQNYAVLGINGDITITSSNVTANSPIQTWIGQNGRTAEFLQPTGGSDPFIFGTNNSWKFCVDDDDVVTFDDLGKINFHDKVDGTKVVQLDISNISPATTRIISFPDSSGILLSVDDIGTTVATVVHDHDVDEINAIGTLDSTTYLRGDGTWSELPPNTQYISVGGRWHLNQDTWAGFSTNFGAQTENYNTTNGTGTDPDVTWNQIGPFVLDGAFIRRLRIAGRANSGEVTGIDLRMYHQTGPWDAAWDSVLETTRTLLLSQNNVDFSGGDLKRHVFDINSSVTGDGFLLVFVRAVGTLTALRYLLSSVVIEFDPA